MNNNKQNPEVHHHECSPYLYNCVQTQIKFEKITGKKQFDLGSCFGVLFPPPTAYMFSLNADVYAFLSPSIVLEEILLLDTNVKNADFTTSLFLLTIKGTDGLCLITQKLLFLS